MSEENGVVSFENLPQSLQRLAEHVRKAATAKQDTFRTPTAETDMVLQFALKHYNLGRIKPKFYEFTNAFTNFALEMGEHESLSGMAPEDKVSFRAEIIAQGRMLDAICELAANERYDANIMRSAVSKAIGCYLYMIHNGNIDSVVLDLENSVKLAKRAAEQFGGSVKGWESLVQKG